MRLRFNWSGKANNQRSARFFIEIRAPSFLARRDWVLLTSINLSLLNFCLNNTATQVRGGLGNLELIPCGETLCTDRSVIALTIDRQKDWCDRNMRRRGRAMFCLQLTNKILFEVIDHSRTSPFLGLVNVDSPRRLDSALVSR